MDTSAGRQLSVRIDGSSTQQVFGLSQLERMLEPRGWEVTSTDGAADVGVSVEPRDEISPEGFAIERGGKRGLRIVAGGESGAMYGLMELGERLLLARSVAVVDPVTISPRFAFRALKFNLPWSSYRPGEVMTLHQETCMQHDYWAKLIDTLAASRFNVLSLWSMHPFPYMVKLAEWPEACPFDDEELSRWRELWRFIFRRAKERGIASYLITWNIFVSPSFAAAHGIDFPGDEYLWGEGDTSDLVKQYNRRCVEQLLADYEDLAGFGTSLGDRMQNLSHEQRLAWVEEVIYPAVREAGREVAFVQRAPFRGDAGTTREVIERAAIPGGMWVEYKFNWSHAHSTPRLSMTHDETGAKQGVDRAIDDRFWNPPPGDYAMVWMARNEDFFILRWGEPDFIREHIEANGHAWVGGYFVGSEGYVPAKDYSHQPDHPHRTWEYAFEKQWLFYLLWGRLLYDPALADEAIALHFEGRYGEDVGRAMLEAYRRASRMPLRMASFHGSTWDYTLYSEGFLSAFKGLGRHDGGSPFISIEEFVECPTLDRRLLSIPQYVDLLKGGGAPEAGQVTPVELAKASTEDGLAVLTTVAKLSEFDEDRDTAFACELDDLAAWGYLSLYFACKLRAGVALRRMREMDEQELGEEVAGELAAAADHWRSLCMVTGRHYQEVPYIDRHNSEVRFSWERFLPDVEDEARRFGAAVGG